MTGVAVAAIWVAKSGREADVAGILASLAPISRAEPGCRMYHVHTVAEKADTFFLYEVYEDQSALDEHIASAHFDAFVIKGAIPLLQTRERTFCQLLDC